VSRESCSADFQSAVSPICNRQSVRSVPRSGASQRPAECNSAIQQSTTQRYDGALNSYPAWEQFGVGSTQSRPVGISPSDYELSIPTFTR